MLLAQTVMRDIPSHFLAGVATGEYRVAGSVIQSVASGRIVGHLQETSALSSLLGNGLGLGPLEMAMQTVEVVQNEQIKAAVAVVQSLQVANLALTGLSIGVSVAGTALLARRIARVEGKVDAILPELAKMMRGIETLRAERIEEDFTRLRTLTDQVQEAWLPSATQGDWIAIARESHVLADNFERRARNLGEGGDSLHGEPFVDAFAMASGLRVTARLAAGQDDMARQASVVRAEALYALGEPIQLGRLALASMGTGGEAGAPHWQERIDRRVEELRPVVGAAREREMSAAGSAETLEELARQGIAGRDWLEAARSEQSSPVLFLPVESS